MKPFYWLAIIILILTMVFVVFPASALTLNDLFGGQQETLQSTIGLGSTNPLEVVIYLIRLAIGFTGLLMVVIIIYAGFKWMLSGGNEEKIKDAKKTLGSAIIGLLIILFSYSIVQFLISSILQATNNNVSP